MWELMNNVVAEKLYAHLGSNNLFLVEQKRRRKQSRATIDQSLVYAMITRDCWRRLTESSVAALVYEMV